MTERIFAVFQTANLPVNIWPYLRELVASITGRMGWLPITLPTLKRGVPPARGTGQARASSERVSRPRRRTARTGDGA
jgi:hypothetical protein